MALVYRRWESSSARSFCPNFSWSGLVVTWRCFGYITNLGVGYIISLLSTTDLLTVFISLAEAGHVAQKISPLLFCSFNETLNERRKFHLNLHLAHLSFPWKGMLCNMYIRRIPSMTHVISPSHVKLTMTFRRCMCFIFIAIKLNDSLIAAYN